MIFLDLVLNHSDHFLPDKCRSFRLYLHNGCWFGGVDVDVDVLPLARRKWKVSSDFYLPWEDGLILG